MRAIGTPLGEDISKLSLLLPFSIFRKKASSIPSWTDTQQPLRLEHNTANYTRRTCTSQKPFYTLGRIWRTPSNSIAVRTGFDDPATTVSESSIHRAWRLAAASDSTFDQDAVEILGKPCFTFEPLQSLDAFSGDTLP